MASTESRKVAGRRLPKWMIAIISITAIIALLAVYAFFTTPRSLKPEKVDVTGSVAASGIVPEKIAFTNTACGTRNVVDVSLGEGSSGIYAIALENGYSYNVSVSWSDNQGLVSELYVGKLDLDTFYDAITRDWTVQP